MKVPVIPSISGAVDKSVKTALDNIRGYFTGLDKESASPTTTSAATDENLKKSIDLSASDFHVNNSSPARILEVTTGSTINFIIAPKTSGREFVIVNKDASHAVTIKVDGGTGVTIASSKRAMVYCDQTDYVRETGDQ